MVADTTNVKADKEATSIKHEKTKTEEVKKKKESTLLKQNRLCLYLCNCFACCHVVAPIFLAQQHDNLHHKTLNL